MKKLVAILVSILFVLSVTGLCFAQAAPEKPGDKAAVADKKLDKKADKKADKKKADKKAKKVKKVKKVKAEKKDEKPAAPPADKK